MKNLPDKKRKKREIEKYIPTITLELRNTTGCKILD